MTNDNTPVRNGQSAKTGGRLSMISILAISAGLAAAPAQAQSVIAPAEAPMQPPVAMPQPTPAPTIQSPPVTSMPAAEARTIPPVAPDRADDLATRGGFDAATVAPEALAQIEREQQARKAATEAAAAKAATARTTSSPIADVPAASTSSAANGMTAAPPAAVPGDSPVVAAFDSAPPVIPAQVARAETPADIAGETDWTLLAALAALLGVGGAGAYAVSRRRKDRAEPPVAMGRSEPEADPVVAATMPELRTEPVDSEARATMEAEHTRASTKTDYAAFIGDLPVFDDLQSKGDRHVSNAQRRVAAAPRPYLGEADLARQDGYFMAHVDAIPTPQNPFLTRQRRLKRARHLDHKLSEMKAANAMKPTQVSGTMQATRPLQPAYS